MPGTFSTGRAVTVDLGRVSRTRKVSGSLQVRIGWGALPSSNALQAEAGLGADFSISEREGFKGPKVACLLEARCLRGGLDCCPGKKMVKQKIMWP